MSVFGYEQAPQPQQAAPQQTPEFSESVRMIIDAVRALAEEGGMTEQERLDVEKITTLIQGLSAGREKEQHDMLGGKMSPGAMARAYSG